MSLSCEARRVDRRRGLEKALTGARSGTLFRVRWEIGDTIMSLCVLFMAETVPGDEVRVRMLSNVNQAELTILADQRTIFSDWIQLLA